MDEILGERLLADAYNILITAGVPLKEIVGLISQIEMALSLVDEDRVSPLFYECLAARGIKYA